MAEMSLLRRGSIRPHASAFEAKPRSFAMTVQTRSIRLRIAKLNRVAVSGRGAPQGLRYTRIGNSFHRTPYTRGTIIRSRARSRS
jgi:hypothetical protein